MFLIAGVSPKTKIIDQQPRRCPVCGLTRACLKRVDHYFSLFFIPILRVKKGEPFVLCETCERMTHEFSNRYFRQEADPHPRCRECGRVVEKEFTYCPYCGKAL